jgi:SAM-dependent methyltransferase
MTLASSNIKNSLSISWEAAVERLRRDPAQRALVEACYYDDPLLAAAQRYHASVEWQAVSALIGSARSRTALELGAGRGIASFALAKDGWRVTAVEPDTSAVVGSEAIRSLSDEAGLSIQIETRWGEQLPFEAQTFDLVFVRAVLHHAHDLPQFCLEAARVLKPGGHFLAIREHVISRDEDVTPFRAAHPLHHLYGGENAFRLNQYLDAITNAGLTVARVFNPYASDINLAPQSREMMLRGQPAWWRSLPQPIGLRLLERAGARSQAPGRLYSFLARKR